MLAMSANSIRVLLCGAWNSGHRMRNPVTARYTAADLISFAAALLRAAGLDDDKAVTVAEVLVEADLIGHTTHGLHLLGPYIGQLEAGFMNAHGEPNVIADRGACVTWDGRRLPGPWLVVRALELGYSRVADYGVVTVVIRRSHHIACLASYLKRATDKKLAVLVMSSEPSGRSIAPYGGVNPVYTTNPIAAGWPTDDGLVMLDISTSITNKRLCRRLHSTGEMLPGAWVMNSNGDPTNDPRVLFADSPGSILPIGGTDYGHKGYAIGLLIEMLTSGLGGVGRADPSEGWGASVFVQVLDPEAFGGYESFCRETGRLAQACRETPPAPWYKERGHERVRLPGDAALACRAKALANGVTPLPSIMSMLEDLANKLKVAVPTPVAQ